MVQIHNHEKVGDVVTEKEFLGWISEKHRIAWVRTKPIEPEAYKDFDKIALFQELRKFPQLNRQMVINYFERGYTNEKIIKALNVRLSLYYIFLNFYGLKNPNEK